MSPDQIKDQVAEFSKLLYDKGLVNAFEGNVSIKHNNQVYITPNRIYKGSLTRDMIVVVDLNGNFEDDFYRPSSEVKIHLGAYKDRPDISAVIHTHSPYATAYALANKPIETKAYPEMITRFGIIPLAPYGNPSTDEVYEGVKPFLVQYDTVLLANHGIMAVGKDILDAFYKVEAAESIAKTFTFAALHGGEKVLPDNKLEELYIKRAMLLGHIPNKA